ncbi:MAG: GNAT family N-acetyltransferase [Treponema sp.]|nr:GNAT family N-acetyltransferase [Treponema sp.]
MIKIKYAEEKDKDFWLSLDKHLSEKEFSLKVRDKMAYIILEDTKTIGIMRYNLFWDNTPFLTMIYIRDDYQKKNIGSKAIHYWEKEMKDSGYGMLMTSTQVDESAQHFYRKLGYKDAGSLIIDIPEYEQPMELFMIKKI